MLNLKTLRAIWLAVAIGVLGSCRAPNQFVPPPPPKVLVAYPIEKAVSDSIEFVGTTEASMTVDLKARVNGYLHKILFQDGASVKQGELLFVIEQAPYQAQVDAARAAVQKANASLQLAESQYRRLIPLVQSGAVTQEEFDIQAAQVATSKADVATANAELRQAELNLSYTEIRSPIDGTISSREVDEGNLIQAEQTLLARITKIDPIYAYFDLSESDLIRFMEMMRQHEIPDPVKNPPVLHLAIGDSSDFAYEGVLDYRDPTIFPGTGTTKRRGVFPNPDNHLVAGMYVRIRATVGKPKPRLLVEERALGSDARGDYLLVVNDDNVVEYRPVKTGIRVGELRVILEGIGAKQRVVVNGLQRARPGGEVRPELVTKTGTAERPTGAAARTAGENGAPEKGAAGDQSVPQQPAREATKDTADAPSGKQGE